MEIRKKLLAGLVITMAVGPLPTAAGNHGLLPGLIIGGIIGSELQRNNQRNSQRNIQRTTRARLPSTQQGREIQTSLNYFSFPAGQVDGQLGAKSRAAISSYQAYMSYPVSGHLTEYGLNFLLTSYQRAILGGPQIAQMVSNNVDGNRGLLRDFRDEFAGVSPETGTEMVTSLATSQEDSGNALPNLFGGGDVVSLASHCNKVSLLTNTNGGFITEAAMSDPGLALSEQFCLARTYAIANGEELASKIQGFTAQQINQQCEGFGPIMRDHVSALSLKPRDAVMQDVGGFVLNSGMAPAQLAGTAKICLSVGYRTDNLDVAIGSALLLAVLGEKPYGELMGHHLGQGFGTSKRPDLAIAWYELGLDAIDAGAEAVFAPGQPERNSLIRVAAYSIRGVGSSISGNAGDGASVALPTFSVDN